jgi:hypothetical protein
MPKSSEHSRILVFANVSGQTIPAHGLIRLAGAGTDGVALATAATATREWLHAVNLLSDVPAGQYGTCTLDLPAWVLYTGTPGVGELWLPNPGTFTIRKSRTGGNFAILGGASGGVVLVGPPYCKCQPCGEEDEEE